MYTLIVKEKFDGAHFLKDYKGKCARIHGHTWGIDLEIEGEELDKTGMLMDFGEIKKIIRENLPDHEFFNEIFDFNPTAELLSKYFFYKFKDLFKLFKLKSVTIWESPDCGCKYKEK